MKKRLVIIFSFLACLLIASLYFKLIYGWMEFRKNTDTPKEYRNYSVIAADKYRKDQNEILLRLKTTLKKHEDFFYSKEYFDGTEIIIDTIVYNSDFNKLAVLFITKNPSNRQLAPSKEKFYFNATTYLAVRHADTLSLSWLGSNFANSTDKEGLSSVIRQTAFRTFVTKDTTGTFAYKYNLDDIRFWDSNVWYKIEDDKIKRRKFEEEKRIHPENVYEPAK